MTNFRKMYKVGEYVWYQCDDFDSMQPRVRCLVTEVHTAYMKIVTLDTQTELYIDGDIVECVERCYS